MRLWDVHCSIRFKTRRPNCWVISLSYFSGTGLTSHGVLHIQLNLGCFWGILLCFSVCKYLLFSFFPYMSDMAIACIYSCSHSKSCLEENIQLFEQVTCKCVLPVIKYKPQQQQHTILLQLHYCVSFNGQDPTYNMTS